MIKQIIQLINAAKESNQKYSDFLYSQSLMRYLPSLSKDMNLDNLGIEELNYLDKISNIGPFKRYRKQQARVLVDVARNAIQLRHSKVIAIFNKAVQITPMDDKTVMQDFIIYEFNYGVERVFLKDLIERYFSLFDKWSKDEKNKLIHCINICLKLLSGNVTSAYNWLKGYRKEFGDGGLQQIPLVSYFAYNKGVDLPIVAHSAFIAGEVLRSRQDQIFERFLSNKTIAIVGNGPQNIGTLNGKLIDDSDVVVRFNNGINTKGYGVDYGVKTNVWVRNNAGPYSNYININRAKFVVLIDSIERMHWKDDQINTLYNHLIKSKARLVAPSRDFIESIFKKYDFSRFTSGLLAVAYIFSESKHSKVRIFGFSSADEKDKKADSFYKQKRLSFYSNKSSNREMGFMNHSFEMEKKLMTDLLTMIEK